MMADAPNPERRADAAILCFCIGAGLLGLSWFLGVGNVIALALSGGAPAMLVGGLVSAIVLALAAGSGGLLMLVGAIWMFVRVIADSREESAKDRYRDVQR
jgi:hypothetical protein